MTLRISKLVMAAAVGLSLTLGAASAQEPRNGGTLRMAVHSEPSSLDPLMVITDGGTGHIVSNIFNTLVRFDKDMRPVPDLAESWTIENDGKAIVFKLRTGVKFHDGEPFNADAVKFAFDRILNEANASPYRNFFSPVESITVVDPNTIRFAFKSPWPGFFYQVLFVGGMGIPSPKAVTEMGNQGFARKPVGTGPFMLSEWRSGDRIILKKNPDYFRKGQPHLDGLEFRVISDPTALTTNLRAGQIDVARDLQTQLLPLLERQSGLTVSIKNAFTFDWLALNAAKPPFNDIRVRQAVNMAIDRQALAVAVYGKDARGSTSQIARANLFHSPAKLPTFTHDPEGAKKLLAEAGQSNLSFTLYSSTVKPQLGQLATVIQAQLQRVGITVKHEVLEHQSWLANVLRGKNFEASTVGGTGGPEPHSYVMFWTKTNPINFVSMFNDELDQLVPKAQTTVDEAERMKLYARIQELGAQEAAWMSLVEVPSNAVLSTKVNGYLHLPYNVTYFDTVWLAP